MNAYRGITLEGTGGVIANSAMNIINGAITGEGPLSIGVTTDGAGGKTTFSPNAGEYAGNSNIVKTGLGTQPIGRNGTYDTALGDVTVNGGELIRNNNTASTQTGTVTVNAGGTLSGSGRFNNPNKIFRKQWHGDSPAHRRISDTNRLSLV